MKEGSMASREASGLDRELVKDGRSALKTAEQEEDFKRKREVLKRMVDEPFIAAPGERVVMSGFQTGATRSTDTGKVDYEGHLNPEVLALFGEYMNRCKVQRDGKIRTSDNWQSGIPVFRYVKSFVRHSFEFWRMWRGVKVVNVDTDQYFTVQDVLCAIMFNVMGILYELNRNDPAMLRATQVHDSTRKFFEEGKSSATTAPDTKLINGSYRAGTTNPVCDSEDKTPDGRYNS
jgi:hypothetical protein